MKLISTELTKNTTRVVEMAVKSEVQNSVLPSLENITKQEVKAALSNQIAKGITEAMKMACPAVKCCVIPGAHSFAVEPSHRDRACACPP